MEGCEGITPTTNSQYVSAIVSFFLSMYLYLPLRISLSSIFVCFSLHIPPYLMPPLCNIQHKHTPGIRRTCDKYGNLMPEHLCYGISSRILLKTSVSKKCLLALYCHNNTLIKKNWNEKRRQQSNFLWRKEETEREQKREIEGVRAMNRENKPA